MDQQPDRLHSQPHIDPQKLAELYPTPLTYDEKVAERQEARRIRLSHRPKYPKLLAVTILGGLVIGILALFALFPAMFTGLGALSMGILFVIGLYVAITIGIPKIRELTDLDTNDESTSPPPPLPPIQRP